MVVDASAALEFLLGTELGGWVRDQAGGEGEREDALHAPALLDAEVAQALRRLEREGVVSTERAQWAVQTLRLLPLQRHSMTPLLPRMWALRPNLTAYDAAYIALAEGLDAPLLTTDLRLARTPNHTARVLVPTT